MRFHETDRARLPVAILTGLVVISTSWAVALIWATWFASHQTPGLGQWISAGIYLSASLVCHQLPERSFHYLGVQMPVCARCTGLYWGAVVAAWAAWGPARRVLGDPHTVARARRLTLLAAVPAGLTLAYEWGTGLMPANGVRAATGMVLGAAIVWLIGAFGVTSPAVEVN